MNKLKKDELLINIIKCNKKRMMIKQTIILNYNTKLNVLSKLFLNINIKPQLIKINFNFNHLITILAIVTTTTNNQIKINSLLLLITLI